METPVKKIPLMTKGYVALFYEDGFYEVEIDDEYAPCYVGDADTIADCERIAKEHAAEQKLL